ncbi:MAG: PAS domain-containing protein, partial [Pseudomonadota bacterium]
MTPLDSLIDRYGRDGALKLLYSIVDNLPLYYLVKDEDLRYILINKSFRRLLDIDEAEVRGKTASELFPPDFASFVEARERRVRDSGAPTSFVEDAVGPDDADGEQRHYITDVRPLEGVNGERLIYIAKTDVTELNAARKAAESADRMKSEFLAT